MGHPAIYPLREAAFEAPAEAVLMDLDGTSVHSEQFWVWIIERTVARMLGEEGFALEAADALVRRAADAERLAGARRPPAPAAGRSPRDPCQQGEQNFQVLSHVRSLPEINPSRESSGLTGADSHPIMRAR